MEIMIIMIEIRIISYIYRYIHTSECYRPLAL